MNKRGVVITGMGTVNPLGHSVEGMWDAMMGCKNGPSKTELFDAGTFPTTFSAQVKNYNLTDQGVDAKKHCHAG